MGLLPILSVVAAATAAVAQPSVTISNGTVLGSTSGSVDSFLGIPFAEPPVGPLRFAHPKVLETSFGTFNATSSPIGCPSQGIAASESTQGEDCLTITVQRPSNVSTSGCGLPVLFWIYGGGFTGGNTTMYDWTPFIEQSIALDSPVIVVMANYRTNTFGFLAGSEIKKDGSSNSGLHDQRLAMQWVQDNIAAFGGDKNKVTIFGESAGSISVYDHLVINSGDNTYKSGTLFQGAIMDSGASTPADPVDATQAQSIYDYTVTAAGCSNATDTLACLRSADYEVLVNATNAYTAFTPSWDPRPDPSDEFFPVSPEVLVREGKVVKVPMIQGTQEDEGTAFVTSLESVNSTEALVYAFTAFSPNANTTTLATLISMYTQDPSSPTLGSPFRTNASTELYSGFKRNAAIIGDFEFILQSRVFRQRMSEQGWGNKLWSYLASYHYLDNPLGTYHGTDVDVLRFQTPEFVWQDISTRYISFVNHLDPNVLLAKNQALGNKTVQWPTYGGNGTAGGTLVQFNADGETVIADDFREEIYEYFKEVQETLRI